MDAGEKMFFGIGVMVGVVLISYASYMAGKDEGRAEQRKEAVKADLAAYRFDSKTGDAEFRYVRPARCHRNNCLICLANGIDVSN